MEVIYAAGGFNGAVGLSSAARRGLGLTGLLGRLKAREGELAGVGEVAWVSDGPGGIQAGVQYL